MTTRLSGLMQIALALGAGTVGAQPAPIRGFPSDALATRAPLEQAVRDLPDPARIKSYLRAMTAVPHVTGTPGSRKVAEWALARFREWGLEASIEQYEAMLPMPIAQRLEIPGPKPWRARLREEVFAEDPDSRQPGILPPYAVYGADGDVTAPIVYANYALPDDFLELERIGIGVRGKLVLARAGPHHRSVKAKEAMRRGALGLIMYNDPKDDGFWLGRPYPRGPMRPPHAVERGGIRDDSHHAGDILSPGWAAKPGTRRLPLSEAAGLPTIPVLSISYADASRLFDALEGPVVPNDGWKGALGLTYHVGPSREKVRMMVRSEWKNRPLYNVIARIPGATRPAEWVLAGNHHDAWVYGADDPVGAAATVMEAARVLSELRNTGWQPNRTLVFALWDGEEQGLLGSTEWVEDHAEELTEKAVIYVNGDNYRRGLLTASGSSMLETFTREVFRDTRDPVTGKNALEVRPDRPFGLTPIGANTDYGAFIQHLGITSLHLAYRNVGRGTYHSVFDSYTYFLRFLDPDLSYGKSQAGVFAASLLRLADAPVLPWSFADAARAYRGWIAELPAGTDLGPLLAQAEALAAAAGSYEQSLARVLALGSEALARHVEPLRRINRAIYQSERTLLFSEGLPGRAWFKYPISGPSSYNGSVARTLPVLREALELKDFGLARDQAALTTAAFKRLTDRVTAIGAELDAIR